ncbi:hypothetical protein QCA50_013305 [Cerrena zonata]|uniref:Major facilitator superfamily (MFS) profile domain-containing protein n=1 Tax=Cerrena zonata TaxID=2478898 RepID=A0AAW0FRJ9_9APHY
MSKKTFQQTSEVFTESSTDSSEKVSFDEVEEKQAVRRLDYQIVPLMTLFYLFSFLDRANIGNARVAGLQRDLNLTDRQFQIAITVTFVPYIAAELPSNLLLRKVGPSLLMPLLLVVWGTVVTLQGVVTSYAGLVTARAFLGFCEGPMFPGIVLYLSGFYTREELSLRVALFFSAASLSGAFSGLLAAAIQNMDGVGGKPGWSWIFILVCSVVLYQVCLTDGYAQEGLLTVVVGIATFFLVPSTPQDCKLLTQQQKDIIVARLARDRPGVNMEPVFSMKEVLRSLSSIHVILVFIQMFCIGTCLYGLALFLPSIVKQLGFSTTRAQLVSVGPFAAGFFVIIVSAYLSDRYRSRSMAVILIGLLAVIGYAMFLSSEHALVAYGSLFLSVPGIYANTPILSAWMANNSEPHYRRATSVALGFVASNAGGILATWSYPMHEGPRFHRTTIMNLVFSVVVILIAVINKVYLSHKNHRKTQCRATLLAPYVEQGLPDGGEKAWLELGDRHPDFLYSI